MKLSLLKSSSLRSLLVSACLLIPSLSFASTILQFTEVTFNDPFVVTPGSIIASNVSVNVTFDPSFCLVPSCGGLTNGVYTLNFNAVPTSAAVNNGGVIQQNYSGTISFHQGLSNLLTVNFSDELTGSAGGSNPTLNASQPPDIFTGSSDVFDPAKLGLPRGLALSFSDWSPAFTIGGSATADAAGTFNATPVPEPSTFLLLGLGLAALAARRFRCQQV